MFRDELILVIDPPGAIKELPNFDVSLGIGASVGTTGGQIQNQTSNPNTVIIAHDRAIAEADQSLQIELWGELAPGFFGFSGTDRKATIKPRAKDGEKAICRFKALYSFEAMEKTNFAESIPISQMKLKSDSQMKSERLKRI